MNQESIPMCRVLCLHAAAKRLGRRFILIEATAAHVALARSRLERQGVRFSVARC